MNNINFLANDNPAEQREEGIERREGAAIVEHHEGKIINLEAIGEHTDSLAVSVRVRNDHNLQHTEDTETGHKETTEKFSKSQHAAHHSTDT